MITLLLIALLAQAPPAPLKVSGKVTLLPNAPSRPVLLTLTTAGGGPSITTALNADGTFTIPAIPSGTYVISIPGMTLDRFSIVTVTNKDVSGLEITAKDSEATSPGQGPDSASTHGRKSLGIDSPGSVLQERHAFLLFSTWSPNVRAVDLNGTRSGSILPTRAPASTMLGLRISTAMA